VSLLGKRDFHVLEASGKSMYGYGSDFEAREQGLLASVDGGRSWDERSAPEPLVALVIDAADPRRIVASGAQGVHRSEDGGRSWRPIISQGGLIAGSPGGELVLLGEDGTVHFAEDDGAGLTRIGRIGGTPAALERVGDDLYAALHDGTVKISTDHGGSWSIPSTP
jgi:hypothetical protein